MVSVNAALENRKQRRFHPYTARAGLDLFFPISNTRKARRIRSTETTALDTGFHRENLFAHSC